ncbi:MAG: hypothetical protein E6H84_13980 [Chloroflexi bacterium]|nr:MAG: hypothetical protein E6H84_13980 [Chloroflexota bacterium]
MARRLHFHTDALADLARQTAWLERNAELSWVDRFEYDLARVRELLRAYPSAGKVIARSDQVVLRRVPLPTTPYLVWYAYEGSRPQSDIWIVRLFHSSQRRPAPDLSRWVPTVSSEP